MIATISFNLKKYPRFQADGNAAQFAIPFAQHVCKGIGVDVGCSKAEWAFPGAIMVDPSINKFHATEFPEHATDLDYIFSSHCLEHIPDWVEVLNYWNTKLKRGGVMFLYLPHPSQEYWLPWNNRKHIHAFDPEVLRKYFESKGYINIFVSGVDLNNSFMIMAEKTV